MRQAFPNPARPHVPVLHFLANVAIQIAVVLLIAGCSVNPVTGEKELVMVSESQEIDIGRHNYAPMQQAEGGVYDLDPTLTAYVRQVGSRLAAVSDRPLPYEFVVLNNSVPNAWALPGGKIGINRGLLSELGSEAELAAVLGHEIVHAAARHSARQMSRGVLLQGLVLATVIATSDSDYGGLAVGGAALGAQLVSSRYGRSAELESDRYGMQYMFRAGYDPQGAVHLQETFVRLNEAQRQDWLSGLFASHPPSPERVQANIATAAALPGGGRLGVEEYRAALRRARKVEPAYAAYDEGRKLLRDRDTTRALELARAAIERYPQEANFYALRGDAHFIEGQFERAVTAYDAAITRRSDYFYYFLQRGLAHQRGRRQEAARRDLEQSLRYLETAPAHYALGELAEGRRDLQAAVAHYQVVAGSGGDYGEAASKRLIRIDLPANPSRYVQCRCDADYARNLVVSVRNATAIPVTGVVVTIEYSEGGRTKAVQRGLKGTLGPGQAASLATGLGPYHGEGCPARVTAARPVN